MSHLTKLLKEIRLALIISDLKVTIVAEETLEYHVQLELSNDTVILVCYETLTIFHMDYMKNEIVMFEYTRVSELVLSDLFPR